MLFVIDPLGAIYGPLWCLDPSLSTLKTFHKALYGLFQVHVFANIMTSCIHQG